MDLQEEIVQILNAGEYGLDHASFEIKFDQRKKGEVSLHIVYGAMYDRPTLGFAQLKALSELFGTDEIDVDDYSYGGCESCDYGSDYGHTIQIYNPTKNIDNFQQLKPIKDK
jgi:hypothetical protein